jgi:HSP20 family protein
MDPFASFDLFRRRVDQMFADFDQQMFGSSSDPFDSPFFTSHPLLRSGQGQQQQQTLQHEKSGSGLKEPSTNPKEEERVIPHQSQAQSGGKGTSDALIAPSSGGLGLFNWPSSSLIPSTRLDLIEEKDKYLLNADVPGFNKDQITLNIKDGMLTLSGETSSNKEESDPERKFHRVERSRGSIYRSIRLPPNVKEDNISASCENGVLKVVIPKDEVKETKKERKVTVQ